MWSSASRKIDPVISYILQADTRRIKRGICSR
nr:MAG TPA: hypothetical protein [Caudoviricetes sp.]